MTEVPNTKEEEKWWKIGFEAGEKFALRNNELAIRIGRPIVDVIHDINANSDD